MGERSDIEKMVHEIPVKRLADLKKDIAKYEENVNKCDIYETNVLAESIGSDIDYLKYSTIKTAAEQKQEIKRLEDQFLSRMDNLRRCRCVKRIEK